MYENLPLTLKNRKQWVAWKASIRDGKEIKIPIDPNLQKTSPASVSNPKTWGTYDQAIAACQRFQCDGIGFVFTNEDLFVGVDLDDCRDPKTGEIEPWAKKIIKDLNSYTEVSPSGSGVHIFVKAKLSVSGRKGKEIEIYSQGRYFTVTGRHLKNTPTTINKRNVEVIKLFHEYFPPKETKPMANKLSEPAPLHQLHQIKGYIDTDNNIVDDRKVF